MSSEKILNWNPECNTVSMNKACAKVVRELAIDAKRIEERIEKYGYDEKKALAYFDAFFNRFMSHTRNWDIQD